MRKVYAILIALPVTEIVLAFFCAPHSCEWGNAVYAYAGMFALIIGFIFSVLQKSWRLTKRIGFAFLFMLIITVVWIACFMLFNFNIMCRMF